MPIRLFIIIACSLFTLSTISLNATQVVINGDLTKYQFVYVIPTTGVTSSSGGGGYSETSLYTGTTRQTVMQLSDNINNYDVIGFHAYWSNDRYGYYSEIPIRQFKNNHYIGIGTEGRYQYVGKTGNAEISLPSESGTWDGESIIKEIIGIKFGESSSRGGVKSLINIPIQARRGTVGQIIEEGE